MARAPHTNGSFSPMSATAWTHVSAHNIEQHLATIAAISAPGEGINRLAVTTYEREAHDYVAKTLREYGLDVTQDAFGNTIATLPGTTERSGQRPRIGTGSHVDSVPQGGRFDGIVGVVGALEAARILSESNERRPFDLVVVVWANEEGARFGQACNGSRVAAGTLSDEDLDRLVDIDDISLRKAMVDIGLDPTGLPGAKWDTENWLGFIELHIEQGAVLERAGESVGIVDVVSCVNRFRADFTGVASHAGGTPMPLRHDSAMAAAGWMVAGEKLARDVDAELRVTFGQLEVDPNSATTIPGATSVWVDVRDVLDERMDNTVEELKDLARYQAEQRGCGVEFEDLTRMAAVTFNKDVRAAIATAAGEVGVTSRTMFSGANHDAQIIAPVIPAGMIFIPSVAGISHAPQEYTELADIVLGVQVLTQALVQLGSSAAGE